MLSGLAALAELSGRSAPEVKKALDRATTFPITLEEIRKARLSLEVARYWEEAEEGSVKCRLCPFECVIPEGNRGVYVLRRTEDDQTHFLTVSFWDSMDKIEAFAGSDPEKARYYPEDEEFLLDFEPKVRHYEVVVEP